MHSFNTLELGEKTVTAYFGELNHYMKLILYFFIAAFFWATMIFCVDLYTDLTIVLLYSALAALVTVIIVYYLQKPLKRWLWKKRNPYG